MPEGGGGELVAGAPRGKGAAVVLQLLHVPTGTARRGLGDSGRGRRLQDVRLVFDDAGLAAVFLALTNELAASARSSPLERRELRLRFQKAVKAVMSEEGRAETRKSVSEEEGSSGAGRMFEVQRVSSLSRLGIKAGPFADLRVHVSGKGLKFFEPGERGGKVGTLPATDIVACEAEPDRGMIKVTAERKMTSWASKSVYSLAVKAGRAQELCTLIKQEVGLFSTAVDQLFQAVQDAKGQHLQLEESGGATEVGREEQETRSLAGDTEEVGAGPGMGLGSPATGSLPPAAPSSSSVDESEDSWTQEEEEEEEQEKEEEEKEDVEVEEQDGGPEADVASFLFSGGPESETATRGRSSSMRDVEQSWTAGDRVFTPPPDLATIAEALEGSPSPAASPRPVDAGAESGRAEVAGGGRADELVSPPSPVAAPPPGETPERMAAPAPLPPSSNERRPDAGAGPASDVPPVPPQLQPPGYAFPPYSPVYAPAYVPQFAAMFHRPGEGLQGPDLSGGPVAVPLAQSNVQRQLQTHSAALVELQSAMRDKDSVISEQNRLIEALEEKLSGSGQKLRALERRVKEQDVVVRDQERRRLELATAPPAAEAEAPAGLARGERSWEGEGGKVERSPAIESDLKRLLNLTFEGMDLFEQLGVGAGTPTPRRRLEGHLGTPSPLRSPLRSPRASPEPNFLEAVLIEAYEDGIEGLFSGLSHDAA